MIDSQSVLNSRDPKKSKLPIVLAIGCGGLLLLAIVLIYIMAKTADSVITSASKEIKTAIKQFDSSYNAADSARRAARNKPPHGLTRAAIVGRFPDWWWRPRNSADGTEVLVGTSGSGCKIRLIGPDSALTEAICTERIKAYDLSFGHTLPDYSRRFVDAVDSVAGDWCQSNIERESLDGSDRSGQRTDSTEFNGRHYTITFDYHRFREFGNSYYDITISTKSK